MKEKFSRNENVEGDNEDLGKINDLERDNIFKKCRKKKKNKNNNNGNNHINDSGNDEVKECVLNVGDDKTEEKENISMDEEDIKNLIFPLDIKLIYVRLSKIKSKKIDKTKDDFTTVLSEALHNVIILYYELYFYNHIDNFKVDVNFYEIYNDIVSLVDELLGLHRAHLEKNGLSETNEKKDWKSGKNPNNKNKKKDIEKLKDDDLLDYKLDGDENIVHLNFKKMKMKYLSVEIDIIFFCEWHKDNILTSKENPSKYYNSYNKIIVNNMNNLELNDSIYNTNLGIDVSNDMNNGLDNCLPQVCEKENDFTLPNKSIKKKKKSNNRNILDNNNDGNEKKRDIPDKIENNKPNINNSKKEINLKSNNSKQINKIENKQVEPIKNDKYLKEDRRLCYNLLCKEQPYKAFLLKDTFDFSKSDEEDNTKEITNNSLKRECTDMLGVEERTHINMFAPGKENSEKRDPPANNNNRGVNNGSGNYNGNFVEGCLAGNKKLTHLPKEILNITSLLSNPILSLRNIKNFNDVNFPYGYKNSEKKSIYDYCYSYLNKIHNGYDIIPIEGYKFRSIIIDGANVCAKVINNKNSQYYFDNGEIEIIYDCYTLYEAYLFFKKINVEDIIIVLNPVMKQGNEYYLRKKKVFNYAYLEKLIKLNVILISNEKYYHSNKGEVVKRRTYDDVLILELALHKKGCVISNDNYADIWMRTSNRKEIQDIISYYVIKHNYDKNRGFSLDLTKKPLKYILNSLFQKVV
ncbi:NYN domain-containing protein, putative [Plasmodium vinckei brucechwatti]|uniref:NYN domain-containing protein, putative n=1 Tax=Plasmodium vinckei brucechwatti TaxID=119398 RepID=A0A6V7S141_PLAVN|nr:NYN domain-containing protein, putative [Plasmodium vinckei brucechwatti]